MAHEALDVVLFSAGGWRVGFEARGVRGARPAAGAEKSGAIEARLGFPVAASTAAAQWLDLKLPGRDRKILVGGPVDLVALPVAAIHPLPPLLAARTRLHGLRALVLQAEAPGFALLFSTEVLDDQDAL